MRAILLLFVMTGCRQLLGFENPSVASSDGPLADSPDAPITCTQDESTCPPGAPFCVEGVCVECTSNQSCVNEQPICGSDLHCRACQTHDDCGSEVCLVSGACADPSLVAYVAPNTTGDCSQLTPCARVELGMQTGKPIIKVSGTVTDLMSANLNRTVDIYGAPGAVITRSNNAQILDASSMGIVSLHDITISGGSSNTGNGIRCTQGTLVLDRVRVIANEGLGLDIRGANLVITRSIVAGNLAGGGKIENTTFAISNSLFVQNGSAGSSVGGVRLKANAGSSFQLNTVADNVIDPVSSNASGVDCDQALEAHSNIVTANALAGNCTFLASLFDVATPGTGNRIGDPKFVTTIGPGDGFYRLLPGSAALDGAISTITFDIDGQPRPVGLAPDMGADELQP